MHKSQVSLQGAFVCIVPPWEVGLKWTCAQSKQNNLRCITHFEKVWYFCLMGRHLGTVGRSYKQYNCEHLRSHLIKTHHALCTNEATVLCSGLVNQAKTLVLPSFLEGVKGVHLPRRKSRFRHRSANGQWICIQGSIRTSEAVASMEKGLPPY